MVMKWVDGVGLNRWMALFRKDRFFPGSAKCYSAGRAFEEPVIRLAQVAHGVHHAHQRGFIHRDLKPSNILIDQSNVAYVTDFGLARKIGCESDLTLTGQILGTPSFMSPEQARGDLKSLTVATDIFSLGAILYWMLTGKPPFEGESTAELLRHIEEDEPQPPSIVHERLDRDLEVVCLKCLRKDPADRYSSAQELAADLERWMRGERVLARRQSRWERVVGWSRRNPVVARLSVATAVLLVSFTGYLAVSRDQLKALAESEKAASSKAIHERQVAERERGEAQQQRQMAEDARAEHEEHLFRLRYREAEGAMTEESVENGLAKYAELLREYPKSGALRARLISALRDRPLARLRKGTLDHSDKVRGMVVHPDGSLVATRSGTGDRESIRELRLFDPATGRQLVGVSMPIGVTCLESGPEGQWLVVGLANGSVSLREWTTLKEIRRLRCVDRWVSSAKLSPDRKWLSVTGGTRRCALLSVETGRIRVKGQARAFHTDWAPDSSALMSAMNKGSVTRMKPESRHRKKVNGGSLSASARFGFAPSGDWIVVTGFAEGAKVWKSDTLEELATLQHAERVTTAAVDPSGRWVATGDVDGRVRLWSQENLAHDTPFQKFTSPIQRLQFDSAGGKLLVVSGAGSRQARGSLWNVESRSRLAEGIQCRDGVAIDRELTLLATGAHGGVNSIALWDLTPRKKAPPAPIMNRENSVERIVAGPDSNRFLTISRPRAVQVWELSETNLNEVCRVDRPILDLTTVGFDSTKEFFNVAGRSSSQVRCLDDPKDMQFSVRLRDADLNTWWMEIPGEPDQFNAIDRENGKFMAFDLKGKATRTASFERGFAFAGYHQPKRLFYLVNGQGEFREIDARTLQPLRAFTGARPGRHWSATQISSDGKWHFVIDDHPEIRVTRLSPEGGEGGEVKKFDAVKAGFDPTSSNLFVISSAHRGTLYSLSGPELAPLWTLWENDLIDGVFTADGSVLLTVSRARQLRAWEVATGFPIIEPIALPYVPACLGLTSDERHVVIGGDFGLTTIPLRLECPEAATAGWLAPLAEIVLGQRRGPDGAIQFMDGAGLRRSYAQVGELIGEDPLPAWAQFWLGTNETSKAKAAKPEEERLHAIASEGK